MSNDQPSAAPGTTPRRLPRRLTRALLARFRKDRSGVTAVEFALVSLPFFAILFAILEVALAFWTSQLMESMVADAARQVYTGQFQRDNPGNDPQQLARAFKKLICGADAAGNDANRYGLFDCHGKIKIDVSAADAFPTGIEPPINKTTGLLDTSDFAVRRSGPNQIVVVRAVLEYPVFVSLLNTNQGNLSNGNRFLMATAAFRNEPFQ